MDKAFWKSAIPSLYLPVVANLYTRRQDLVQWLELTL